MYKKNLFFILFFCLCANVTSIFAVGEKIEGSQPRAAEPYKPTVSLANQDINASIGALIMEEYFYAKNLQTFRKNYNDELSFFRNRLSIILKADQGKKKNDKAIAELYTKITSFNYWQRECTYTPLGEETLRSAELDSAKLGTHKHNYVVPVVFLEDAFLKINFDPFISALKNFPTYTQFGLFDYQLGRGIALGNYNDGSLNYLGWDSIGSGIKGRSIIQSPAGIVVGCKPLKNLTCEFYFSRWNELAGVITDANANTRNTRIFGKRPWRGTGKDRESFAFKIEYDLKKKRFGDLLFQPYFNYTRSPEQTIEVEADASSKIYTPGIMIDYKNKNWLANFEFDAQFGHQDVHAIDRNDVVLAKDSTTGDVYESYTHIYDGADITTANKARVTSALKAVVNTADNRTASMNGHQLVGAPGSYNAGNVTGFPTANRIRNGYKIDYRSIASLLDVGYEFDKIPFRVSGAAAYIGGDSFPYNNESNKTYKGFVTLRDYVYWGYLVKSFASLFMRYMTRPLNIDYAKMYAPAQIRDTSNMQYFGVSTNWYPFKNRKKMDVMANLLWFWEVGNIKKWDKHSSLATTNSYIAKANSTYGFNGWLSDKNASKFLGTEFNVLATFRPISSLDLYAYGYLFAPGGLYKDIDGQPSPAAVRATNDPTKSPHELVYGSLGHDTAFGFTLGAKFDF